MDEQAQFFNEHGPIKLTSEQYSQVLKATFNNMKLHEIEEELIALQVFKITFESLRLLNSIQ